jgi:16S rRNA (uracil1498-N3)-methyltransferase
MPQYFSARKCMPGSLITIEGDDYYHLTHVRRAREGDGVYIRDREGTLFTGWIARIMDDHLFVEIAAVASANASLPEVILGMAIIKHSNFDLVAQKAVEVGVSVIVPIVSSRSVVDIRGKQAEKVRRWQKIADEAAKQSMRPDRPEIREISELSGFITKMKNATVKIIAHPGEKGESLRTALAGFTEGPVTILVGPEGGFSPEEIAIAIDAGFKCVNVGITQMRAETAGIVMPALVINELMEEKRR